MPTKGSALIWIIGSLFFAALLAFALYFYGRTFLFTEGLDQSQINTYQNAIDNTRKLEDTMNQSNKNALEKLNKIEKNLPFN